MKTFEEKKFNIPALTGLSAKTIEEHLKLYSGYVKNANAILEKISEYQSYAAADAFSPYVINELQRRFAFEFDGMRNHEYYFSHLEGGSTSITTDGPLESAIREEFGSYDAWLVRFKAMAMTRGVGWAILYYDKTTNRLLNAWIDEQHLGHLTGLSVVLALDMWEHSFIFDYQPSGKKQYVEDFFTNLNWSSVEENYTEATK